MKMIIGITGQSKAGKDTMADWLVRQFVFGKISLADPMKRFCQEIFDFSDGQLWGPSEERNKLDTRYGDLSPRVALQLLGTEWGRACYQDIWVEYAMRTANKLLNEGFWYDSKIGVLNDSPPEEESERAYYRGVAIPDCRFKNEMEAVRRLGGKLIRIKRPGATGNVGLKGHASEEEQKSLPDSYFDYVINNDKEGLEFYYTKIDEAMEEILRKKP